MVETRSKERILWHVKLSEIQISLSIKFYWNVAIVIHLLCLWPAKVRVLTVWLPAETVVDSCLALTFKVSESVDGQGVTGRTKGRFGGNA